MMLTRILACRNSALAYNSPAILVDSCHISGVPRRERGPLPTKIHNTTDPGRSEARMRFLVSGGGGYIGSRLCHRIIQQGSSLTVMGRSRPEKLAPDSYRFIAFELSDPVPSQAFEEHDCFIHLAHSFDDPEEAENLNEVATQRLLAAARSAKNTTFIYISSQSAREDAPTEYGRTKWRVEQQLVGPSEIIVRPGMVYGGNAQAVFGLLCKLVQVLPIVPTIGTKTQIQPIHVDDLCQALLSIARRDGTLREYNIAMTQTVSYRGFLKDLAHRRFKRRILTLPIPLPVALFIADFSSALPGFPAVPRERILGLTGIIPMLTTDSLADLKLEPRELATGLYDDSFPVLRALIFEGRILLGYLAGERPSPVLVRRYVRALQNLGEQRPLTLPGLVQKFPTLLRFMEPVTVSSDGISPCLNRRLEIALSVLEMSPQGARLFSAYTPANKLLKWGRLFLTLVVECFALPVRLLRR